MSSYFENADDNDSSTNESEDMLSDNDDDTIESSIEDDEVDDDDNNSIQVGGVEDNVDDDDDDIGEDPDEDDNEDEDADTKKIKTKKVAIVKKPNVHVEFNEDDDEDDDGTEYLQKFDKEVNHNYILNYHPECVSHNYDEILSMTDVIRNEDGIIIDPLHKTIPFLTKYEKSRILGQRAKQINSGSHTFVKVPENVIDGYVIAELELKEKKIPFIIRRPLPNGGSEYWKVKDLEDISF